MALTITALTVLSGWITTVTWGNFFDQGLALVYPPVLASVPAIWGPLDRRRWLMLASLWAGLTYTYPICLPFALCSALTMALPWCWRERRLWRRWLLGGGAAVALAALLVWPGAACLQAHMGDQYVLAVVVAGKHGMELFSGLLNPRLQPAAFWALGGETFRLPGSTSANVLGVGLTILLIVGLAVLWRQKRYGLATTVFALAPVIAYFLAWRQHPYAIFKILTLNWWCLTGAVVVSAQWIIHKVPPFEPASQSVAASLVRQLLGGRPWLVAGLLVGALLVGSRVGSRVSGTFFPGTFFRLPKRLPTL
jgi:hypothetical protein